MSKDLHAALDEWTAALRDGDADSQVRAANRVEAQGTRLVANGLGSERLQADPAVVDSLAKFATTVPNAELVTAYNRAVRAYEDDRNGAARVSGGPGPGLRRPSRARARDRRRGS